jgi:phosphate transport system substrate-binding protein
MRVSLLVGIIIVFVLLAQGNTAVARDQIRAVGSSTVFPFVTTIAENFANSSKHRAPIIEPTGTGGGIKLFCAGVGEDYPDIVNASRQMKPSESQLCKKNGVLGISEFLIGYDGIVFADSLHGSPMQLTRKQIFLALAKRVPQGGKLVFNPYKKWNEIDKSLPDQAILVYGPPPTSGTRDVLAELVLGKACEDIAEYVALYPDVIERRKACSEVREDGIYVEAGENDNLIVQKLNQNPEALGIFGFSFLDQNADIVQGALVEGVAPEYEQIKSGKYAVTRPLYVYVKKQHIGKIDGLKEFILELTSDRAVGEEGYTTEKGLVPLPKVMHDENKKRAATL